MSEANIVMLPIGQLHPHPNNPRDDLGDISELAASIAKNGIMQNLTVVKDDSRKKREIAKGLKMARDKTETKRIQDRMDAIDVGQSYTVIIGHRRLCAAAQAGLEELPCAVVKMGERQQIETMLSENMMREELTIAKQVSAFQQLHFLGASAGEIAETTGFSESTVQRRLRYGEKIGVAAIYIAAENAAKQGRQLTLDELDKVCAITDDATRKSLSAELGTNNFSFRLQQAKQNEENIKNRALFVSIMEKTGIEQIKSQGHRPDWSTIPVMYATVVREKCETAGDIFKACGRTPPDGVRLFCVPSTGTWGTITWRKPDYDAQQAEQKREREESRRRMDKLSAAFQAAYRSRLEFVKNNDLIMAEVPDIMRFLTQTTTEDFGDWERFAELSGYEDIGYDDFLDIISSEYNPEHCRSALKTMKRHCFLIAYCAFNDDEGTCGVDPQGRFHEEWRNIRELRRLYDYLEKFGYEISDDETALLDGTSPLYNHEEEESDD